MVAAGRPGLLTADMVKPGAAVLDVGITRTEAGLVGDVDPGVAEVAGYLAPMPGGVGPMTGPCCSLTWSRPPSGRRQAAQSRIAALLVSNICSIEVRQGKVGSRS